LNNPLSNIELYYTYSQNISNNKIIIEGEEYAHITKVMRHSEKDELYITDGNGKIYSGLINRINKTDIELEIGNILSYENKFRNIHFCIPKLKSNDRLEFALEKCTELGITNFVIFNSERTISKANKIERWKKILLSGMKQSLRSYLPKIEVRDFNNIINFPGTKAAFEQSASKKISEFKNNPDEAYYFIFGPEGGLSEKELNNFEVENIYKIFDSRLRTETAVVSAAALITSKN
jgi:16S rRNA (uracil1498-N3)-methyltransferase